MALTGWTALSVPRQTTERTRLALAASMTFEPTQHIGLDRLHREELARWNLLERRGVKDQVHVAGGLVDAAVVAHITEHELDPRVVDRDAHLVLLQLVAAENPNFRCASRQQPAHHGRAERSSAARYQNHIVGVSREVPSPKFTCRPWPSGWNGKQYRRTSRPLSRCRELNNISRIDQGIAMGDSVTSPQRSVLARAHTGDICEGHRSMPGDTRQPGGPILPARNAPATDTHGLAAASAAPRSLPQRDRGQRLAPPRSVAVKPEVAELPPHGSIDAHEHQLLTLGCAELARPGYELVQLDRWAGCPGVGQVGKALQLLLTAQLSARSRTRVRR